MDSMEKQLNQYHTAIENYLSQCFLEEVSQKQLLSAMRYSLLAGGKRIRPILTLEFCKACGGDWRGALPFACAVEMIHTYSLIHDDLPCMDNDDYRRGKPTNHRVYGEATAVLAGDGLLTAAFATLSHANVSCDRVVKAIQILSRCAGYEGMVGGQVLDMEGETRPFSSEEIHRVQELKTGALIVAACLLGVVYAGGNLQQMDGAKQYAQALGLAFQTRDDILDVIGDFQKLGKETGMDGKKNTFVGLYGIERCKQIVQEQTQKAADALRVFQAPGILPELAFQLAKRES